jgi:hypothetical protein
MLTGVALRNALTAILSKGTVILADVLDAIQVTRLAENVGEAVVLIQGGDHRKLVVEDPSA